MAMPLFQLFFHKVRHTKIFSPGPLQRKIQSRAVLHKQAAINLAWAMALGALSLTSTCLPGAQAMSKADEQKLKLAKELFQQKKGLQSRKLLTELSAPSTATPEILCLLADSYMAEGADMTEAERNIVEDLTRRAIRLDPQWGNAYKIQAQVENDKENYRKAIEFANKALSVSKPDVRAYLQRCMSRQALGLNKEALADITYYIAHNDNSDAMWRLKASLLQALGQRKEEVEAYKMALKAHYSDYNVYQLVRVYEKDGQLEPAVIELSQLIKATGQDAEAYQKRGAIYARQKKYKEALADYTRAIQIEPNPRFYQERAEIYKSTGNHKAALADLNMSKKDLGDPFGR